METLRNLILQSLPELVSFNFRKIYIQGFKVSAGSGYLSYFQKRLASIVSRYDKPPV